MPDDQINSAVDKAEVYLAGNIYSIPAEKIPDVELYLKSIAPFVKKDNRSVNVFISNYKGSKPVSLVRDIMIVTECDLKKTKWVVERIKSGRRAFLGAMSAHKYFWLKQHFKHDHGADITLASPLHELALEVE